MGGAGLAFGYTELDFGDSVVVSADTGVTDTADYVRMVRLNDGRLVVAWLDSGQGSRQRRNDYSLQLDGYTFIDALSLYATAGYKWRGNTDAFETQDDWFAGAGGSYRIVPRTRIGMAVSYRPDPVEGGNDDATDLTVYVTRLAGRSWWVEGYALTGLSDGSPDWGVGGSVTFELMRRK